MLLNLLGANASIIGRARYFFWNRHYTLTLRVGLILLCIALTITTALLVTSRGEVIGMLPVAVMVGLALFLFVYYNLERTLLVALAISMLVHDGVSTGTETKITFTFMLLLAAVLIWCFRMVMVDRAIRLRPSPANLPGLLFMVIVVISTLWSGTYVEQDVSWLFADKIFARGMSAIALILAVAIYFLFANTITSLRAMRFFVWWFIAVGALFLLFWLTMRGVPHPLNYNGQFSAFVVILALSQALFNHALSRPIRIALVVITLGWLYVNLAAVTWLSGWLPALVGVLLVLCFRSRKFIILVILVGAISVANNPERLNRIFQTENAESGETRLQAWGRTLGLTEEHLLFGMGPAGYRYYFSTRLTGFFQLSHNNYVDILAQTGIAGFAAYIWFWLGLGIMAWRTSRAVPRGGFRQALAVSLVAVYCISLLSMMLGDWITPFTYTQGLQGIDYTIWHWMFAGMIVALYYETRTQPQAQMVVS